VCTSNATRAICSSASSREARASEPTASAAGSAARWRSG
jgi:hypothetical protein